MTVDTLSRSIMDKLTKSHHRVKTTTLLKVTTVKFRNGEPPRVLVRTEKRMNHNYTLVQGLDGTYGFDVEKVAEFFKHKLAGATNVEEQGSVKIILVQGFWDREI